MDNEIHIPTQKAQIYGGPLDGAEFTVNTSQDSITVGAIIQKSKGESYWKPASNPSNTLTYTRTGEETEDEEPRALFSNEMHVNQPVMA